MILSKKEKRRKEKGSKRQTETDANQLSLVGF